MKRLVLAWAILVLLVVFSLAIRSRLFFLGLFGASLDHVVEDLHAIEKRHGNLAPSLEDLVAWAPAQTKFSASLPDCVPSVRLEPALGRTQALWTCRAFVDDQVLVLRNVLVTVWSQSCAVRLQAGECAWNRAPMAKACPGSCKSGTRRLAYEPVSQSKDFSLGIELELNVFGVPTRQRNRLEERLHHLCLSPSAGSYFSLPMRITAASEPTMAATCGRIEHRPTLFGTLYYPHNLYHAFNNFLLPLFFDLLLANASLGDNRTLVYLLQLDEVDPPPPGRQPVMVLQVLRHLVDVQPLNSLLTEPRGVCFETLIWGQDSPETLLWVNVAPWGHDHAWRGLVSGWQHAIFVLHNLPSYFNRSFAVAESPANMPMPIARLAATAWATHRVADGQTWELPESPRIVYFIRGSSYARRHIQLLSVTALQSVLYLSHHARMQALQAEKQGGMVALMRLMQSADVILGVFGANLANALFMRPGGIMLEFVTCTPLPNSTCAGWADNTPASGDNERNRDYLTLARHARLAYYCADLRRLELDENGGTIMPSAYVARLAADLVASYAAEHSRPAEGLDLNDVAENCEPSQCAVADPNGDQPALSSSSTSRCYMNRRPNCWAVSLGPRSQGCSLFVEPYELCPNRGLNQIFGPVGRF